jgi:hypothetical protein
MYILLLFVALFFASDKLDTARQIVRTRIETAWKSASTEPMNLIILDCDRKGKVYRSELERIFVSTRHLPDELKPRGIYCTSDNCERKIQYIGKATESKFTFVLFRRVEQEK